MHRKVFDRTIIEGYRTSKTESIAITSHGRRMFVSTNEGTILLYECRPDTIGSVRYTCAVVDTIRKGSKERKPISHLVAVESWRALICIIEGILTVYDSQFYQLIASITEQKGSHLFSVQENIRSIVLANKKKLYQYSWQSPGFVLIREYSLSDVPKCLQYIHSFVIIGYKKHYECLDLITGNATRMIDVDKEYRMIALELPANKFRSDSLLLSLGEHGIIVNMKDALSGTCFAFGSASEERIEWLSSPLVVSLLSPYLVSILNDAVEIHDLVNFQSLQHITVSSLSAQEISYCSSFVELSTNTQQFGFICNGEQLSILKLIPISRQVEELTAQGMYEEAISLCILCEGTEYAVDIDINKLHQNYADLLLQRNDFEAAISHYIKSQQDFTTIITLFPAFVPTALRDAWNILPSDDSFPMQEAAPAIVHFCDFHRINILKKAKNAQNVKDNGIVDAGHNGEVTVLGKNNITTLIDDDYLINPDEDIRKAELLDTVLLFALIHCNPPCRSASIHLLSSMNFCQIEASAVLLASQGFAFMEVLLWLYRSHNQHITVLKMLTEEKCVATGGWSKDQFYQWSADYLRYLWYHETDISLPKQALQSLKPLIEYDAELSLSVLLCRPNISSSTLRNSTFGGKGLAISEVLTFLKNQNVVTQVTNSYSKYASLSGSNILQAVSIATPLINGQTLAIAFLECIVSNGEAPNSMHDEFVQLLLEGINMYDLDNNISPDKILEFNNEDSESLKMCKIYRKKLQNFLLNSTEYHPQKILKLLPVQYLHESALVLSRLGDHNAVLNIYITKLADIDLAESYCDRIFTTYIQSTRDYLPNVGLNNVGDIYIVLFKVLINHDQDDQNANIAQIIRLAEKYFDRIDPCSVMELLPPSTPVALILNYSKRVIEHASVKKRNYQIIHQLLRVREVQIRTFN